MSVNGTATTFGAVKPAGLVVLGVRQTGAIAMKARWGEDTRALILTGESRGKLMDAGDNESVLLLTDAELRIVADASNTRWSYASVGDAIVAKAGTTIVADNRDHQVHVNIETGVIDGSQPVRPYVTVMEWQIVQKLDGKLEILGLDSREADV